MPKIKIFNLLLNRQGARKFLETTHEARLLLHCLRGGPPKKDLKFPMWINLKNKGE